MRNVLAAFCVLTIAACGGGDKSDAAIADSLSRDLQLAQQDSTNPMADTAANQQAYPQQKNQQPGCGFPIVRIVVVFSLSVGTVPSIVRPSETNAVMPDIIVRMHMHMPAAVYQP